MIIRKIEIKDSENFLYMLKQLDNETKYMMFEPEERKITIDEIKTNIKNINISRSLTLVAEDTKNIVGFLAAERGFAKRIEHSAYIVIGILKDYRGKKNWNKIIWSLGKMSLGKSNYKIGTDSNDAQ